MSDICDVEGCENIARPMGWCNKHYRRWKKYGDPERTPYERAPKGAPEKFFREASESETDDCIIWPYGKDGDGYGFINGKAAHREMCKVMFGDPEGNKDQACHSCGNPSCINFRHLRWATKSENMQDKHKDGTMPMGETHWRNR